MKMPNAAGWWWSSVLGQPVRVFMVRRDPVAGDPQPMIRLPNGKEEWVEDREADEFTPIKLHEGPLMVGQERIGLENVRQKLVAERVPIERGVSRRKRKPGQPPDPNLRQWMTRLDLWDRAIAIVDHEINRHHAG